MINKWIKYKHSKSEKSKESNQNFDSHYRSNNFNIIYLFRKFLDKSDWIYNRYNLWIYDNSSPHYNISNPENGRREAQFFSDYAVHSKDIAKIINDGYGNTTILGSVYGFEIEFPKEPEMEDIGKAKIHLENDYPNIWKEKQEAFKKSKECLEKIKEIEKEFNIRFQKIIQEKDIFNEFKPNFVCIHEKIIDEILKKIKDIPYKRVLRFGSYNNNPMLFTIFFDEENILFSIRMCHERFKIEIFKSFFNRLVTDTELKKIVKEYEEEVKNFYNNNERTKFFNSIRELYKDIVNENKIMNKKGMCNSKGCINKFSRYVKLMDFVSD